MKQSKPLVTKFAVSLSVPGNRAKDKCQSGSNKAEVNDARLNSTRQFALVSKENSDDGARTTKIRKVRNRRTYV